MRGETDIVWPLPWDPTADDVSPASPDVCYTTLTPKVSVHGVMQDLYIVNSTWIPKACRIML